MGINITKCNTQIPAALCALHNFICHSDPTKVDNYPDPTDFASDYANGAGIGDLPTQAINAAKHGQMSLKREQISQAMWDSYMAWIQREGADLEATPPV